MAKRTHEGFFYLVICLALVGFFLYGALVLFFEATQTGWSKIDWSITYLEDPRHPPLLRVFFGAGSLFFLWGAIGGMVAFWRGIKGK